MSFLFTSNPVSRIRRDNFDHFDLLPDSILLIIFSKVADVKDLGRCCTVSRRFYSLVPLVENVLIHGDSFICDDDSSSEDSRFSFNDTSVMVAARTGSFIDLFRIVFRRFYRPFVVPKRSSLPIYSPTQVLKNFSEIRFLKIELLTGELEVEDGNLLKWRAAFGSTLDNCIFLVASSMTQSNSIPVANSLDSSGNDDNGNIPNFKLILVLTICSVLAALSRHYLLEPVITEHQSLDRLTSSDAQGQGVLTMNREHLEEFKVTPFSASKSEAVPALNMRMWHAPQLNLPDGTILKGATLVATRPSESKKEVCDVSLLSDAFEEPFRIAAKMLIKKTVRIYNFT